MLSTQDIRRKIRTVKNIQQICKAMKTVSSVKLRKAEERYRQAQPYADALQRVVNQLGGAALTHPLLEVRDVQRTGVVAISADKGLAGSYNANVVRQAIAQARAAGEVGVVPIGRRVHDAYRRLGFTMEGSLWPIGTTPEFRGIAAMADHIGDLYVQGAWDRVNLVYNRHGVGVITEQLLPIQPPGEQEGQSDFIFEPNPTAILEQLLPRYLRTLLFTAVLSASAAEHAARVAAMSLASENAEELIDTLTMDYNKSRQAAITRELGDIVGASEAMR
ncbi:MAG: ATP synthase F1 subunit gamma [Armatimonadota bacterium]